MKLLLQTLWRQPTPQYVNVVIVITDRPPTAPEINAGIIIIQAVDGLWYPRVIVSSTTANHQRTPGPYTTLVDAKRNSLASVRGIIQYYFRPPVDLVIHSTYNCPQSNETSHTSLIMRI